LSWWVKLHSRRLDQFSDTECLEPLCRGRSHFKPISPYPHTLEIQTS